MSQQDVILSNVYWHRIILLLNMDGSIVNQMPILYELSFPDVVFHWFVNGS